MRTLSKATIEKLKSWGWDFMPTGPNEWEWMKFDAEGKRVAVGGDSEWQDDLTAANHSNPPRMAYRP